MFKIKSYLVCLCLLLMSILFSSVMLHKNKALQLENTRLQNNIEYYSALGTENIVLRNTIDELEQSKDSLVQRIMEVQRKLALKPKEIKEIVYVETVVRDTIVQTIPETYNFSVVIEPNELTSIAIDRQDTTLTVVPDIRNHQTLFIQAEKRWKYKGFFRRLIHFNWKKITTNKYYIDNSNDLIHIEETRIIDVVE